MENSGNSFDVIIIGAGIMGSCAAYEAAKRGRKVLLLEQYDFLHHLGSSHGESRTFRATYPESYYPSMVIQSSELWEEAEAEAGYRVLYKTVQFDMGPAGDKSLLSMVNDSMPNQIDGRVLERRELADMFGGAFRLPEGWTGVVSEIAGVIKPTKAVAMFQSLAAKRGAVLKDNMEVKNIERGENGGVVVVTANGDKFQGFKCIVAAGAWTKKLVKFVSGLELPIQPLHTTICYWKIKEGHEVKFSIESGFPTFASYGRPYIYGTPALEFPGMIKIAWHGGHPCDPDKRDWILSSGVAMNSVADWIKEVMPDWIEYEKPVMTQACMYSMTPDEDFVIDFLGGEFGKDVVVAGGFSGHGFKMGPLVGRILTELAIDGKASQVDLKHFSISRFDNDFKGNDKDYEEQVVYQEK